MTTDEKLLDHVQECRYCEARKYGADNTDLSDMEKDELLTQIEDCYAGVDDVRIIHGDRIKQLVAGERTLIDGDAYKFCTDATCKCGFATTWTLERKLAAEGDTSD